MNSRFAEGDILRIRGNKYRVEQVDVLPGDRGPHQYRLEPLEDAPPANLSPVDSRKEEKYAIREYYNVDGADIEVIEGDE